jgi:hypothetical protein
LLVWKTFWLWKEGPWDLPRPGQGKTGAALNQPKTQARAQRLTTTETIISKNLFDPERGASLSRETEANSKAFQRIRGMVLLGTAIIGNNRLAIVQDGGVAPSAGPAVAGQTSGPMRIKLGDMVEGFTLSEIADKRIVFSRGPSRVELILDYFRKVDARPAAPPSPGQVRPPSPVAPRVVPNLPRKQTMPGKSDGESNP